jgi:hypothetical protein
MLLAAISLSGCVYVENVFRPAPTTTPVVTATPAPMPTATPAPTPVATKSSNDVKVLPVLEKGLIFFESYPGEMDRDKQYENISIYLANDGASDAKDVVVTLSETDAHGANSLVQQDFKVGDMKKGERKIFAMVTDEHEQAGSILIKVNLKWGEYGEYNNPTTFIDVTKSIIWMMK